MKACLYQHNTSKQFPMGKYSDCRAVFIKEASGSHFAQDIKRQMKEISRIPPEYSGLPKLSLLPAYESLASGCQKTNTL